MKIMFFLAILAVVFLSLKISRPETVTSDDLISTLSKHAELYDYSQWEITSRTDTEFEDYVEIEFAYRYRRIAKTHIAIIRGDYTSVDNAFVNDCIEHKEKFDCRFVTEIGTVEYVQSDHARVIIDHWGVFSRDNFRNKLLSKKTSGFLNRLLNLFKSDS
jgi:hypothetical protein